MHEARQTFCLDIFSMFHRSGSCSTLSFFLVMQITSYENKGFRVLYNTHADFRGEISGKIAY